MDDLWSNVDVMWNIVEGCGCFVDVMWKIVEECGCNVEDCGGMWMICRAMWMLFGTLWRNVDVMWTLHISTFLNLIKSSPLLGQSSSNMQLWM